MKISTMLLSGSYLLLLATAGLIAHEAPKAQAITQSDYRATYQACMQAHNNKTANTGDWIAKASKAWDKCYNMENLTSSEFLCSNDNIDAHCWLEVK
jgi:hypothetical protein